MTYVRSISNWKQYLEESKMYFETQYNENIKSNLSINDFILIQTISCGSFTNLIVSQLMMDEKIYLIEINSKEQILKNNLVSSILEEKRILQGMNFPFCPSLLCTFQDNSYVYKCLSFANGGSLLTHLKNLKKLEENVSVFIGGQIALGLEYLHGLGLIFRRVSSENVFLDGEGYVKLGSFTLCKRLDGRTYTLCGPLDYLAPEVLTVKGYGQGADWWAFGVLLYELNSGRLPFAAFSQEDMFLRILKAEYELPQDFSQPLVSLVKTLLEPDLTKRCGSSLYRDPAGYIKSHGWFQDVNWLALLNRHSEAPFQPKVCGPDDLTHYESLSDCLLEISENDEYSKYFKDF